MLIYTNFSYTGDTQEWTVPRGVTRAYFECWGAAGGMSSKFVFRGKKGGRAHGEGGPPNKFFTNDPTVDGQLGESYANNAGYAAGLLAVEPGEKFRVNVGGNGGPGLSTIKVKPNGSLVVTRRGGSRGWNGGGLGGRGAKVTKNLFNAKTTKVNYSQDGIPNGPVNKGQLWHDTNDNVVYRATKKYGSGDGTMGKWKKVTANHLAGVGPSAGGGGGATDIRKGGNQPSDRILVAGGGGGAGGRKTYTGDDAWTIVDAPASPSPPFGADRDATGPTGINHTWASELRYLAGGWGRGGLGGATGPDPGSLPVLAGGRATVGEAGAPATGRHHENDQPTAAQGSGGKGGSNLRGGSKGAGGTGGQGGDVRVYDDTHDWDGSLGTGGDGGDAAGEPDDFCAGGGGGGAGFHGGGGGGHGFKSTGKSAQEESTHGGGGGGGSNFAGPQFLAAYLLGAARPPSPETGFQTGANGLGGFARISYRLAPEVEWLKPPFTAEDNEVFPVSFRYTPAGGPTGSPIDYYTVGFDNDENATAPATQQTVAVQDDPESPLIDFTYEGFVGPNVGTTTAFFVKVVDEDGDASEWLKLKVKGTDPVVPATITEPSAGDQVYGDIDVEWTPGAQSPTLAYRLGVEGDSLRGGDHRVEQTGWRLGGSRVNLARDPGFTNPGRWDGMTSSSTTYPGVSGTSGRFNWGGVIDDLSAVGTSDTYDNLIVGRTYRLNIGVTSTVDNDDRPVQISVSDGNGLLTSETFDLTDYLDGEYLTKDIEFTPSAQGVFFEVRPSDSDGVFGNADASQITHLSDMLLEPMYETEPVFADDFERSGGNWTGDNCTKGVSTTDSVSGTQSLKIIVTASALAFVYVDYLKTPVKAGTKYRLAMQANKDEELGSRTGQAGIIWRTGAGVQIGSMLTGGHALAEDTWETFEVEGVAPSTAEYAEIRFRVTNGLATEVYYLDDVEFAPVVAGTYFDGDDTNGNDGTGNWSGTPYNSASTLTGADDTERGVLEYRGVSLTDGVLFLDTETIAAHLSGAEPARATVEVSVNASVPALPEVVLTMDHSQGNMVLDINADDAAKTNKTVAFDIFRGGVRVCAGLKPHSTLRTAQWSDTPAHNDFVTYKVRALDMNGGYRDQTEGGVNEVF